MGGWEAARGARRRPCPPASGRPGAGRPLLGAGAAGATWPPQPEVALRGRGHDLPASLSFKSRERILGL